MNKNKLVIFVAGRIPSKKNSKQIVGRGKFVRLIASQAYLSWKKQVSEQVQSQLTTNFLGKSVKVDITINFPDNRRADLTNKAESLMDMLVDEKVIDDDKWQIASVVNLTGELDKTKEVGATITITEL